MIGIKNVIQTSPQTPVWEPPKTESAHSLYEWFLRLFVTPDVSGTRVQEAKDSLEHYVQSEAATWFDMVGAEGVEEFAKAVQQKFDFIVHRAFDDLPSSADASVSGKRFAKAMRQAGKAAVNALDRLKVDAARIDSMAHLPKVDVRPQVISKNGRYVVIRPAPQIENLVLRGGGTKGVGYGAALDQMSAAGLLAGVKHMAGSSAGALMATCLACGMTAVAFDNEVSDKVYRSGVMSLLGGGTKLARVYPDLALQGGLANALGPLRAVDKATAKSVQKFLTSHANDSAFQTKVDTLLPKAKERLSLLSQPPDFKADRSGKMVTFGDLKLLHELAPDTFKLLTVTSWNRTDQKEVYLDAETSPDRPVAYAARASMAYPVVFKAVAVRTEQDGKKLLADGGIGSNMPSEVFTHPRDIDGIAQQLSGQALEETRARTMLLTFDENGGAYQVMHGAPPKPSAPGVLGSIAASFINYVSAHPDQAGAGRVDDEKIRAAGPNTLPVFHGDIGVLVPRIKDSRLYSAQLQSAQKAWGQIEMRMQQAYAMDYYDLKDAAAQLTEVEKTALRSGPDPTALQQALLAAVDGQDIVAQGHDYC